MINVLINGCNGNMGTILSNYIKKTPDIILKYGIDRDTPLSFESISKTFNKPDVIIDFSTPEACFTALDYAVCNLVPVVIATTGFNKDEEDKILEYSEAIPIFKCANMSYTINLMCKILSQIAPLLSQMDIEIIEKHHSKKKDSPSGTAFLLANSINSALNNKYEYVFNRHSINSPRLQNEIGISSIRGGNLVGEHSVLFLGEYESIEVKHTAYSREVYAEGAIRSARFIIQQKNGLYGMTNFMF